MIKYFISLCSTQIYPRGGGHLLVSCVPMREQKTMRKGTFFQAGHCAALSLFRIG